MEVASDIELAVKCLSVIAVCFAGRVVRGLSLLLFVGKRGVRERLPRLATLADHGVVKIGANVGLVKPVFVSPFTCLGSLERPGADDHRIVHQLLSADIERVTQAVPVNRAHLAACAESSPFQRASSYSHLSFLRFLLFQLLLRQLLAGGRGASARLVATLPCVLLNVLNAVVISFILQAFATFTHLGK